MNISITIKPGISPFDRGDVEDLLVSALDSELGGTTECLGGGTLLSKSGVPVESDLDIRSDQEDPLGALTVCKRVLSEIPFTMKTEMTIQVGDSPRVTVEVAGDDPGPRP